MGAPPNPEMDYPTPIGCLIALVFFVTVDACAFALAWWMLHRGY